MAHVISCSVIQTFICIFYPPGAMSYVARSLMYPDYVTTLVDYICMMYALTYIYVQDDIPSGTPIRMCCLVVTWLDVVTR